MSSEVIAKGNAGAGRPKKKEIVVPVFKSDADIRKYLFNTCFKLMENMNKKAMSDNNIKKPEITRAKSQQFKLALDSIKLLNQLLKDKQIDDLSLKINMLEEAKALNINKPESSDNDLTNNIDFIDTIKLLEEIKLDGFK